jgi:hypothetical protein
MPSNVGKRVFLSVGAPHLPEQEAFVRRLEASLRSRGLTPWTLGRANYDFRSPLRAIRESMEGCAGAVIVGLGRRFHPVGIDRYGSHEATEKVDFWCSTPWSHLEAGMAYQIGLPLLILKDRAILAEGILDQAVGEYLVYAFELERECKGFSKELRETIAAWSREVRPAGSSPHQP